MQRIEEGSALLTQREERAAQTSDGLRACVGAETARDLLLRLEQAHIPLGFVPLVRRKLRVRGSWHLNPSVEGGLLLV